MLCPKGEAHRFLFGQVVARRNPFEQLDSQVMSQRLLDDFAVALICACRARLDGAEQAFVD